MTRSSALRLSALAFALAAPLTAQTQTTATFDLVNVLLLPDISQPWTTATYPMTGTFVWTYTPGDFANGSGQFTSLSIPWWTGSVPLTETIETNQIELSIQGNYQNLGCDVTLKLLGDFGPFQSATVDPVNSTFDIQDANIRQGHIVSGTIVPRCPTPEHYGVGTAGSGSIVPQIGHTGGEAHIGSASFTITGSQLLGGAFAGTMMSPVRSLQPIAGIDLLLDPALLQVAPTVTTGPAGTAGVGTTSLTVPIPNLPSLVGGAIHFQIAALDPGSTGGIASASDGLTVTICN